MAVVEDVDEDEVTVRADALKADGNAHFGRGEWKEAVLSYDGALEVLSDNHAYKDRVAVLHNNKAAALIKLEEWVEAADEAGKALDGGADEEKARERRAFALSHVESRDYKALIEKRPDQISYRRHVEELEAKVAARNEAMKDEVISKLKDLGNLCLRPFGLSTDSFQLEPNGQGGYSVSMKK